MYTPNDGEISVTRNLDCSVITPRKVMFFSLNGKINTIRCWLSDGFITDLQNYCYCLLHPRTHSSASFYAHTHAYPVPCYTPIKKHKSPVHLPDFVFIVNLEARFLHATDWGNFPYFPTSVWPISIEKSIVFDVFAVFLCSGISFLAKGFVVSVKHQVCRTKCCRISWFLLIISLNPWTQLCCWQQNHQATQTQTDVHNLYHQTNITDF